MALGGLDKYLREQKFQGNPLSLDQKYKIMLQINTGMRYLESHHVIHRDLSARNILVDKTADGIIAKISDFGMGRFTDSNYYSSSSETALPVRWCAPEVLEFRQFSHLSDVYSLGVTFWEILTDGKVPWSESSNQDVIKMVCKGSILPQPENCSPQIYSILQSCWTANVQERINFEQVGKELNDFLQADQILTAVELEQLNNLNLPTTTNGPSAYSFTQANTYSKTEADIIYQTN